MLLTAPVLIPCAPTVKARVVKFTVWKTGVTSAKAEGAVRRRVIEERGQHQVRGHLVNPRRPNKLPGVPLTYPRAPTSALFLTPCPLVRVAGEIDEVHVAHPGNDRTNAVEPPVPPASRGTTAVRISAGGGYQRAPIGKPVASATGDPRSSLIMSGGTVTSSNQRPPNGRRIGMI